MGKVRGKGLLVTPSPNIMYSSLVGRAVGGDWERKTKRREGVLLYSNKIKFWKLGLSRPLLQTQLLAQDLELKCTYSSMQSQWCLLGL